MQRENGGTRYPDGRLPAETYRRRRRAVSVALLLTVGVTAWALTAGGGDTSTRGQAPSPDRDPAAAGSPSDRPGAQSPGSQPAATVTVSARPTATTTVTAQPTYSGPPCRDVGVRLAAHTRTKAYGEDEQPEVTVRVTPQRRCVLDPDKLTLVISSGTEQVWSSRDCPGPDRWPQRIAPQHPYRTTITWKREHSNPATCGEGASRAGPGWYAVAVTLGGQRSGETAFRLKSR